MTMSEKLEQNNRLEEALSEYWDCAYQEGHLGRPSGDSSNVILHEIRQCFTTPQPVVASDPADVRASFEGVHCGGNKHATRRNEVGDYVLPSVADAWAGWKSSAKLFTAPQPAPDVEAMQAELERWKAAHRDACAGGELLQARIKELERDVRELTDGLEAVRDYRPNSDVRDPVWRMQIFARDVLADVKKGGK